MKHLIHDIYKQQEKVREDLVIAMRRFRNDLKEFITASNYYENPNGNGCIWKGKHYGCKDDIYYYYILPEVVPFIYQNSLYHAKWIFFNDKYMCWFVYDEDKNEYVTFEALDTDSQIALCRILADY